MLIQEHGAEVRYPSYVDMDPYIDIARLKGLDTMLRERIEQRIGKEHDLAFYTGPFLLDGAAPALPGSRLIYLSRSEGPDHYYDLDKTELWRRSPEADAFLELMDFIATLPFKATGRMLIMYDGGGRAVSAHRDHDSQELCHEFIWLRTNFDKPFYMQSSETGERLYVSSHSAWFDTVNQYHGADATGGLSFSVRVDGVFSDEFRALIPFASRNPASTPSHWAGQLTQRVRNETR